jgi:hypothetical protein
MRCSKCGAENPDWAKFCEECASPLTHRCLSCDTENSPTAKFCIECANPLEGEPEPAPATPGDNGLQSHKGEASGTARRWMATSSWRGEER